MNQPAANRFFLFICTQFSFVSCIWLSTNIKDSNEIVKLSALKFSNRKTVLIRIPDGDSQMIGDTLGLIECNGTRIDHIEDRYPRIDMKNGKIPNNLRAAIETVMPNVLFKSDYCSTIETKETLFLNETQWKTQVERHFSINNAWAESCVKTYYKTSGALLRSKFSEKCNRIPEYSHIVDFTSDEIKALAGDEIYIRSGYSGGNNDLLNYILHYVTLGIVPMSSDFHTYAEFYDCNQCSIELYYGTMSRSLWNYFIWPVWIFIPDAKIRFGSPKFHFPTSQSLGESFPRITYFFKVKPFQKAMITKILEERLPK
ncbi:hypothetical protein [Leptospira interrogans]|uniref:hypothetical protein n=1 Tax=Leptospira interrogans TaxID=173 RepID=UPI0009E2B02C|nr:hypothetical protein [Leptospira interrogans]